jgi:signal transduction histidine kinase
MRPRPNNGAAVAPRHRRAPGKSQGLWRECNIALEQAAARADPCGVDESRPNPDRSDADRRDHPVPRERVRDGRSPARAPGAAADASNEVTINLATLAHELNNMLDGAMRYLSLARRGVTAKSAGNASAGETVRQLEAATDGLSRMATLIERAMRPHARRANAYFDPGEPLVEALLHAADAMRPLADDRGIRINVDCSPRLVLTPAGPVYTILINAIRNSIDAIGRDGVVEVIAELRTVGDGSPEICLDILDDGPGPRRGQERKVFEFGFTTTPAGDGVGLALCKDIVDGLGGSISLERREEDRPTWSERRPGAHLSIRYPAPTHAP